MAKFLRSAWRALTLVPVAVVVNDYLVTVCQVPDDSMAPTLRPNEDTREYVLVSKTYMDNYMSEPSLRGQVVFLRSPSEPDEYLLRRVVGLPGDWISTPDDLEVVHVPKGRCWVEGDNKRSNLETKETFCSGLVPVGLIQGHVRSIVWPPARMGELPRKVELRRSFHVAGDVAWKMKKAKEAEE